MTTARYQNPHAQVQEGIAVAHTLHGTPTAGQRVAVGSLGAVDGRIAVVPQAHQRDYEPPKRRHADKGHSLCSYEDCKAYPSKKWPPYCAGHAVTMGLRENPKLIAKEREAANGDTD